MKRVQLSLMPWSLRLAGLVFCVWFAAGTESFVLANTPRLNLIMPRGMQRGTQQTLRFMGERIGDTQQVFFYDAGITVAEIKPVDGNQIDVIVNVAADCRVGEHVAQVRTPRGISDYRSVFVGYLSSMDEVEPNTSFDTRQKIEINKTLVGTVTNEDVDYFVVTAKKGERISAEVEAIRLGSYQVGTYFDPFVAILDDKRFELAVNDDTSLFNQDPFVSVIAPEDGNYTVMIREASYGGNDQCRYRLHIGNFPRPTAVYPAGGNFGAAMELNFLGDPSGEFKRNLTLPAAAGFRTGLALETENGSTPSPMPFRFNDLPNHLEIEPNDTWVTEPVLQLPQAFNGIINKPGDMDYFLFEAKKGQVWEFECYAKRIGSRLDPVMHIFKATDKSVIAGNDDSRGPDSYLRFQAPDDGQYYVRIYDHLQRGQSDFVYRLEASPVKPALSISIPRVDRYSQLRQTISVPQGNRFGTLILGTRENLGGELKLLEASLPPGIKMTAPPMSAGLNLMPVVFEADPAAELAGHLVDFQAQLNDPNNPLVGGFTNLADFANGEPNAALYYGCTVNRLAMAVTKPAPFKIEIVQPQAPLVRDGSYNLRVVVKRDEAFKGPVNLQFPFVPPGVGTTNQVTIPPEQSEIVYPLNANGNAQLGIWPIFVLGYADVDGGPLVTSTQMAELTIAEPYVRVEIPRAGCDQGQTAQLVAKFEQVAPFEGEATLTVVGLPPNIVAQPVKFTKDTTELVIPLPTTEASPIGQHKSLFCQLEILVAGEKIVAATGRTELQVNKPAPAPVAAAPAPAAPMPAAAAPATPPPPPPPLSRLEQLRLKAKGTGGSPPNNN
ncbi:MAG: PPC domain-containing protein [Pirellulaceae bacterium]